MAVMQNAAVFSRTANTCVGDITTSATSEQEKQSIFDRFHMLVFNSFNESFQKKILNWK